LWEAEKEWLFIKKDIRITVTVSNATNLALVDILSHGACKGVMFKRFTRQ